MRIYEPKSMLEELATNGIGKLTAEYAVIHGEINGEYSLTFRVAQSSEYSDSVIIGAIVKADTPEGQQLFRCSKPITMLDGGKEVFAWHISYDLAQDIILNRAWTGKTGAEALPDILQAGISETRFTGTSDIDLVTNMRIVRTSVLGAIIGEQDNSFVNRWGGEIERDNFTVNILSRLGADKGVIVRYRKNLTGLTLEEDNKEIANRIIPTGLDEDDTVIMLPEVYIDSDLIDDTPIPHVRHVHFSDVKVGKKDDDDNTPYPDVDSVRTELRARVAEMYAQGVDLPLKSAEVKFIDLSQTEEYKNYKQLETVGIGDTITCIYRDINLSQRVISYDYDALAKKYINIVLGNMVPLLGDSLWAQDLDLSALKNEMTGTVKEGEVHNGITLTHEHGVVTSATIDGIEIEVRQNSQEGFALYADSVYIGGVKIVDGKAVLMGSAVETSAVISGKTIVVKQNPEEGFALYADSVYVGGIKVINGQAVLVSNILTNDIDGDCYVEIGEFVEGSTTYTGVFIYRKISGTNVLVGRITVNEAGSLHLNSNGAKITLQENGLIGLHDSSRLRGFISSSNSSWISPNGDRSIGVNNTGAYKVVDGIRTYL